MLPDKDREIPRRDFLTSLSVGLSACAASLGAASAHQNDLYVLKPGDFERLRVDFNANRGRVRLMAILSPT
jgi:hypothetical protein